MHLLVIGGDAAGMSAASRARRIDPQADITVLEKTTDVSYSACGMPYNIADPGREMDDLVVREAKVFREKHFIDLRLEHLVTRIDRDNKKVKGIKGKGEEFELDYDKLVIATGASPMVPDIPGITHEGVMPLKSLRDGREMKSYILANSASSAVIIGMGYIAMEMAEALRDLNMHVAMVKPRPRVLPWLQEELSEIVTKHLQDKGVELYPGYKIQEIQKTDQGLNVACEGIDLPCDFVLSATGIVPNSQIASDAGLILGPKNTVGVDRYLCTNDPDIYAAGDCSDAYHVVTGNKTWIPLALWANRGGRAAADNIYGKNLRMQGVAGTAVFKVFDLEVAKTGLSYSEAKEHGFDPVEVNIKSRSRAHNHPGAETIQAGMLGDRSTGLLLGAQMVGREGCAHRINAVAVALHYNMLVEDFWQTDLSYAPPFGPVWDPLLTAANQLSKQL